MFKTGGEMILRHPGAKERRTKQKPAALTQQAKSECAPVRVVTCAQHLEKGARVAKAARIDSAMVLGGY